MSEDPITDAGAPEDGAPAGEAPPMPPTPLSEALVLVRFPRVHQAALEAGVELGTDLITGQPITVRLEPQEGGAHVLTLNAGAWPGGGAA